MLKKPVEAVLFDMDGLLLDTEAVYIVALQAAARTVGREMPVDFCHSMIGVPGPQCNVMIQAFYGDGFHIDVLAKCLKVVPDLHVALTLLQAEL